MCYCQGVRTPQCPKCSLEVHASASVCPSCKTELAQCAWCRDVTSLGTIDETRGRFGRERYVCDRCGRLGQRCRTLLIGGYCNGLARAEGRLGFGRQLCASCTRSMFDAAKTVAAWTLIGLVGSRLRPGK